MTTALVASRSANIDKAYLYVVSTSSETAASTYCVCLMIHITTRPSCCYTLIGHDHRTLQYWLKPPVQKHDTAKNLWPAVLHPSAVLAAPKLWNRKQQICASRVVHVLLQSKAVDAQRHQEQTLLQAAMPCEDAGNSTQANSFMIQHRPAAKSQCTTARTHDLGPLQCRSLSTY